MQPAGAQQIIFVVGNSRSGTTMMGRVLGRHSRVFTFNELHFFEQMWQPRVPAEPVAREQAVAWAARLLTIQRDGYYTQGDPRHYEAEAAQVVDATEGELTPPAIFAGFVAHEAARAGKEVACDQTPRNLYYLHELLQLYPAARAVVVVRDPRDVMLSQKHRWRRRFLGASRTPLWNAVRTWAGYHPLTMAMLWRSGVRAGERFHEHPRVTLLRFEDLVRQPEQQVRTLCDRLGLQFEQAMLEVPRVGSSHKSDEPAKAGIDASAAERWKHGGLSRTERAVCERVAGEVMTRWGYELQGVRAGAPRMAAVSAAWVGKSALAFLMNVRRVRRLGQAVRRRLQR